MKTVLFLVSNVLGFLAGHYLFRPVNSVYAGILISYHLVLAGLVFIPGIADPSPSSSSNPEERFLNFSAGIFRTGNPRDGRGLSLPFGEAMLTHLACLALAVGLPYFREHVPYFGIVRYLVPGVAFFECQWLFSGGRKKPEEEKPQPISGGTAEDHDAFLRYLAQPQRRFNKPGRSVNEEQALWLADRMKQRAALEEARRAAGLSPQRD
jgi:hypothetical protein